jgi:hypothetical protein
VRVHLMLCPACAAAVLWARLGLDDEQNRSANVASIPDQAIRICIIPPNNLVMYTNCALHMPLFNGYLYLSPFEFPLLNWRDEMANIIDNPYIP